MQVFKKYSLLLLILPVMASCTKVIDLKLGNDTGKLVIEGNITNKPGAQTITISRNVAVTATNTYPAVSGATVTVKDQEGRIYLFNETSAGIYTNSLLTGAVGNTYTMSVSTDSKIYSASSEMPQLVQLD